MAELDDLIQQELQKTKGLFPPTSASGDSDLDRLIQEELRRTTASSSDAEIPVPGQELTPPPQTEPRSFELLKDFVTKPVPQFTEKDLTNFNKAIGLNVFFDPETDDNLNPITRPFRKFNTDLAIGASRDLGALFKGLESSFKVVAGGIADIYEGFGASRDDANRLQRDLLALPEAFMAKIPGIAAVGTGAAVVGSAAGRVASVENHADEIIKRAVNRLPQNARARAEADMKQRAAQLSSQYDEARAAEVAVAERQAARLKVVNKPTPEHVVKAQEEILAATGAQRVGSKPLNEQVYEAIAGLRLDKQQFKDILVRNNITMKEVPEFLGDPTVGARQVQEYPDFLHVIAKLRTQAELGNRQAQRALDAYANREWQGDRLHQVFEAFHKFENIRRGLMVSSLRTAVRNATVATGRVSLDVMTDAFELTLGRLGQKLGVIREDATDIKPMSAFGSTLEWLLKANSVDKKGVENILKAWPHQYDRFVGNVIAQVDDAYNPTVAGRNIQGVAGNVVTKGLQKAGGGEPGLAEKAVFHANIFNRFQEFVFRRAKFAGTLDTELKKRGTSLNAVIKENNLGAIDEATISKAVNSALDFTFASDPESKFVKDTVQRLTRIPGFTLEIPFPRFIANASRFLFEHSPGAAFKLLSSAEWAKMANGDVSTISKMTAGSMMMLGAWQLTNSGYVKIDDEWNHIKVGDKVIDLKPYGPFSAYVFIADLVKRHKEGRIQPNNITISEVMEGVLSQAARLGTGLEIADGLLDYVLETSKANKEGKGSELAGKAMGNYVSSFLTPLNQFSDLYAQFDANERKLRDPKAGTNVPDLMDTPFFQQFYGAVAGRFPRAKQQFPEKESSTRADTPESTEFPFTRFALGLSVVPEKRPIEKELARLGFTYKNVQLFTGVPTIDRLLAREMGEISDKALSPFVESPNYKAISDDTIRIKILRTMLESAHKNAREQAKIKNPELFAAFQLLDKPLNDLKIMELMQADQGIAKEDRIIPRGQRIIEEQKKKIRRQDQLDTLIQNELRRNK